MIMKHSIQTEADYKLIFFILSICFLLTICFFVVMYLIWTQINLNLLITILVMGIITVLVIGIILLAISLLLKNSHK